MADKMGNDTLTFLNDFVDLDVSDKATVGVQVTGTWTATITWTGSIDGVTYFGVFPNNSAAATIAANATVFFNVVGLTRLRLTATAYTSGTAVVNYNAVANNVTGVNPTTSGPSQGVIAGTGATSLGKAEDAVHASGDTGIAVWGVRNEARTTLTSGDGDYSGLAVGAGGEQLSALVGLASATTAGLSNTSFLAAGSINATVIKASAGNVYLIEITNTSAAFKYVKFYNKTTTPAPATDNGLLVKRYGIAPNSTLVVDFPLGIPFTTGIGLATVTGTSDTDATAVTAADLMVNVTYR